jgi:beta-lactamase class D
LSCKQKQKSDEHFEKRIESSELQTILDSLNVNGAILIFDFNKNSYYANNFQLAEKNSIPASTFKIPNSVIGLETGILQDEKTVFKWNGEKRAFPNWEKDLTLKEAFQSSCVPCYQELAKKIGIERMNDYLAKLNFGEMVVTDETLANFWLIGSSKISPFQQIDFLKRLYTKELPISESTNKTVIEILKIEENINFTLSGKTGLAVHLTNDIGWFVGYLEKNKEVFYFATNISPNDSNMDRNEFLSIRKTATLLALKEMKFID